MTLSDQDLEFYIATGELSISPLAEDAVQPASVDVRLGANICVICRSDEGRIIDPYHPEPARRTHHPTYEVNMESTSGPFHYDLYPGNFVLGHTFENVKLGRSIRAQLDGRSTVARYGIVVHTTAGFIDPGFDGQVTLEIYNVSPNIIRLRPMMPIGQLEVMELKTPCKRPYGDPSRRSKYQGSAGVVAARTLREQR